MASDEPLHEMVYEVLTGAGTYVEVPQDVWEKFPMVDQRVRRRPIRTAEMTDAECRREMRELERVPLRDRLYGRSRMNGWPLWISWLLADNPTTRGLLRELMHMRRKGVNV